MSQNSDGIEIRFVVKAINQKYLWKINDYIFSRYMYTFIYILHISTIEKP